MKRRCSLGFDTSCYTTSAALVDDGGEALASSRMLLPVQPGQRGLRQSEAVFAHVRQMPEVMDGLSLDGVEIVAVCASASPRAGEDSYMPVFAVGLGHARVVATALGVPLYATTHQQGHIAAGLVGGAPMDGRFVALHVSGGTTDALLSERGELTALGGSADLHAGQLIDRVGVAMGLGFPAGPALERLAMACDASAEGLLPASLEKGDLVCHLSGAETKALRLWQAGELSSERLALEVFDLLARTLSRMVAAACKRTGARQALVVGGVASSALLRQMLLRRLDRMRADVDVRFGRPEYSSDNAVGVAAIGMRKYLEHTI